MKKKLLGLLLATSVVAASFAGCGNESSSTSASAASATDEAANPEDISGEITFVSANDQTGALDEMIDSFNKVYPNVVVNHESLPGASDDIKESLMTSLARKIQEIQALMYLNVTSFGFLSLQQLDGLQM